MKKAYMIFAYNNADKVNRLIRALNYNCDFFVHLDKKADIKTFENKLSDLSNVYFCRKRVFVNWAGWSQIQAIMAMLEAAVEQSVEYSHIVLITETDYPLWGNQRIEDYLTAHAHTEFVMAYNCTRSPVKSDRNRIKHVWWYDWPQWTPFLHKWVTKICNHTIFACMPKSSRCVLEGKAVDVYFGQMLFAVTPVCAKHILHIYYNDDRYNRYMKTTFASCELYYHTIVFNSKFREKTIQGGQEHEITPDFSWAPLHFYNYADKIKIYKREDYDTLINSVYPFFRKALVGVSDSLMDAIDQDRAEKNQEASASESENKIQIFTKE